MTVSRCLIYVHWSWWGKKVVLPCSASMCFLCLITLFQLMNSERELWFLLVHLNCLLMAGSLGQGYSEVHLQSPGVVTAGRSALSCDSYLSPGKPAPQKSTDLCSCTNNNNLTLVSYNGDCFVTHFYRLNNPTVYKVVKFCSTTTNCNHKNTPYTWMHQQLLSNNKI